MPIDIAIFLAGLIFVFIGGGNLPFYIYDWYKNKELRKTGKETIGVITESVTYPNDDSLNSGQYRYTADFKDDKGNTHFVTSRFADSRPKSWMNKEVPVIYQVNNPKNASFKRDISPIREVVEYLIIFLVGVVLIVSQSV